LVESSIYFGLANSFHATLDASATCIHLGYLVEEAEDLAGNVLAAGLLVVHDTSGGGQDDETELTGGKELLHPLLHILKLDVVAGGDDTSLVEAAVKLDDDLAVAVVVNLLELANVTWRSLSVWNVTED
jgi:hypothetical protein